MLAPAEYARARTAGYLDTATYGLPPARTVEALERALRAWQDWEDWMVWERDGEACRELFAGIVGGGPEQVSLQSAVSVAAGIVAASLPAAPGDNVVCYEADFHSCLFPFMALERRGVEVRLRSLEGLASACDGRTRLVAVSAVQSADGRVADLAALRATGARVFVDGTQAVGAIPVDLDQVDYLAVGGYKWLLCPRGLCFVWVRPERLEEIEPWLAGWKSYDEVYERYYGTPRTLANSARRLDTSLAWHVAAGSRASLSLIAELGSERISAHNRALTRRFCEALDLAPTGSSIVQVSPANPEIASERLLREGIRCATRAGALRFAFHLYNTEADVDLAAEALRS